MKNLLELLQTVIAQPLGQWWLLFSALSILVLLAYRLWLWHYGLQGPLSFGKLSTNFKRSWGHSAMIWFKSNFTVRSKLKAQLPLFLRTLGSTLKAGYSVPQALEFTAQETEDPLKFKLKAGLELLQIKQPLELVLAAWKQDLKVPEFGFLAERLVVQARRGGNLVSVCYSVASLLEDRQKLERDLKSFTAQGKMSGLLMALLWPVSLCLFAWLSPSHTDILFNTPAGRVLLALSLSLELIGFLLIWRLVRLKI